MVLIRVDRAGERLVRVTQKPWLEKSPYLQKKNWVFEVEFLEEPGKGRKVCLYLGDLGVVSQKTPRGTLWNRTNHLLRTEEPRTQKLARTATILVLIGAIFIVGNLFLDPPSILLAGIGVTLAVVALIAAIAGYRTAGR